jgi:ribose 5-phosphate isomerase B
MIIYLGADHRGFNLKEKIKTWLKEWGYEFEDLGNTQLDPEDDYPDFAAAVVEKVARVAIRPEVDKTLGILICGSGVGMDVVANKIKGIRCGLGFEVEQIRAARREDDINCLALAADYLSDAQAKEFVKTFLETEFLGEEKYRRRIEKIAKYETA